MKTIIFFTLFIGLIGSILIPFIEGYDTFGLGVRGWTIVSGAITAIGFCSVSPNTLVMSLICGFIVGIGMQLVSFCYFNLLFKNRETFLRIEILIPIFLGALPGVLLYNLYLKVSGRSNINKQAEKP